MIKEWAAEFGWNLQLALAGFWGGTVDAFRRRKSGLGESLTTVVTGMVTANYLGGIAVKYTGAPELATGFIVGLTAMVICRRIYEMAQKFSFGKGSADDNRPQPKHNRHD